MGLELDLEVGMMGSTGVKVSIGVELILTNMIVMELIDSLTSVAQLNIGEAGWVECLSVCLVTMCTSFTTSSLLCLSSTSFASSFDQSTVGDMYVCSWELMDFAWWCY